MRDRERSPPLCLSATYRAFYSGADLTLNDQSRRSPAPWIAISLGRLSGIIPVRTSNFSLDFVARQFLRDVKVPEPDRLWRWSGAFNPEEVSRVLTFLYAHGKARILQRADKPRPRPQSVA